MSAPQRSEAWFESRKGRVTGSRVGAILGGNPYQSRQDVLREMVREWYGVEREFSGNAATRYGTKHEDDARRAYEFETGNDVELVGLVVHPEVEWLAASPDGLIGDLGAVEFKCPYRGLHCEIASHYYHQMQLVMACTQTEWCDFYEWTPDDTYHERVPRDPDWLERVMPDLEAFMVEFRRLISDRAAAGPYLADSVIARTDPVWQESVARWKQADAALKAAQEVEKSAKDDLIALADGMSSEGSGVRVIRTERKGAVDYKAIPQLADVNLDEFRKPPTEYFTVRRLKEDD